MKSILLGAAVAGMLIVSVPTQSYAQFGGSFFAGGPTFSNSAFSRTSFFPRPPTPPRPPVGPPNARPDIGKCLKIIFRLIGVSPFGRHNI